jgi:hypothetical protein
MQIAIEFELWIKCLHRLYVVHPKVGCDMRDAVAVKKGSVRLQKSDCATEIQGDFEKQGL